MQLVKIFIEVRFDEPSLIFDDARTRANISKQLKKNFPISDYNQEQKFLFLVDPQKSYKCLVHRDRLVIDFDQIENLDSFKSLSSLTIQLVMKELEVESTQRIGVRANYIEPDITTEKESAEIINKNFLNFNNALIFEKHNNTNFQPRVGFTIDLDEDGYSLIINIGYHQVGNGRIDERGQLEVFNVEKIHPLVDLDIYTNTPKSHDQINGVLKLCVKELPKYAEKVWEMRG
jgi:hypothetical protein